MLCRNCQCDGPSQVPRGEIRDVSSQGGAEEAKRRKVSQEDSGPTYPLHDQINNREAVSHAMKYGSRLLEMFNMEGSAR